MRQLLSPSELAHAIGVSESSLKRWVDAGRIRAVRTEGGHRRIPIAEAIRFIRERRLPVVRPELLGLPAKSTAFLGTGSDLDALQRHLEAGDVRQARAQIMMRYLEGESIADLCDGPIRGALERIGELWKESDAGIFVEHRASDVVIQLLGQFRAVLEVPPGRPVALGCALSGDNHLLPSLMAATVLAGEDFDAINLGHETPITAFEAAIAEHDPVILWVSVMMPPTAEIATGLARLLGREADARRGVVIGGRHVSQVPLRHTGVHVAASMRELAAFARGVQRARA